jgi:hypothetical protein
VAGKGALYDPHSITSLQPVRSGQLDQPVGSRRRMSAMMLSTDACRPDSVHDQRESGVGTVVGRLLSSMCPTKRPRGVARGGVGTSGLERAQVVSDVNLAEPPALRFASSHHLTTTRVVYQQALQQHGLDSVLRFRIPLAPPVASHQTFSAGLSAREKLQ